MHGYRDRALRENAANMSWHVVGAFVGVLEDGIAFGHQAAHKPLEVSANHRIGIFAEDERCAGVMNEDVAQAHCHA